MRKANLPLLFALLALAFAGPAFSQQRWERNYGGAGDERGFSVKQTSDTGYIVVGYSTSFGNGSLVYLIKTDASGDILWTKTFGGGASWDRGYSVQQTSDGGYIVAGYTGSYGNSYQVYLIKTNTLGDSLWIRNYGDTSKEYGYSVQQTSDGGYIVAGETGTYQDYQVYLIKTNAQGDTLWTRSYGRAYDDQGYSVQQTSDGGYIVAGTCDYSRYPHIYLIKTNASGDTLWTKTYGDTGYDYGYSVQQTSDSGYIVAGLTNSFGNYYQIYLIKTNATGDTLWTRTYGGSGSDWGYSVQQTSDGGYIITGTTTSFGNGYQVYLIKTDANGNSGVEDNSLGRTKPLTSNLSFSVVPNPFTSFASVLGHEADRFTLYDISGRRVGTYRGDRIGADVPPGVYFVRAEKGKGKPLQIVKVR